MTVTLVDAEEGERRRPGHVEGGDERRPHPDPHHALVPGIVEPGQDLVLGEEPGEGGQRHQGERRRSSRSQNVTRIGFLKPPMSDMLLEWTAWITDPEQRNKSALKKAWVHRWNRPAV